MSLKITEEWVKERIKMDHDKLEDVRSLALPGSYHEKIASLSTSLSNFSRLQQLDVSRNAISSLDGLAHLKYLETLNLYYNQIPDLKEVFKLRKNQSLKNVDLRLNPVTKTEPDYRLFVVHMLPLLRTLDDRPVRESERKAALMHFSNEQAAEMEDKDSAAENLDTKPSAEPRISTQPRAEYVKNMIKKPTFVTEDDTCLDVIDLMNRNGGNIRNERAPTGGVLSEPETEDHTHEGLVKLTEKDDFRNRRQRIKSHEEMNGFLSENDMNGIERRGEMNYKPRLLSGSSSSLSSKKSAPIRMDEYRYTPDDEAYTKFRSVANFTRHPGTDAPPPTVGPRVSESSLKSGSSDRISSATPDSLGDEYTSLPTVKRLSFGETNSSKPAESTHLPRSSVQAKFLEEFLDLVDKYWNGSRSLHYHKKFKSLIEKPLARYEEGLTSTKDIQFRALQDKIATLTTENKNLHTKLHSASKQKSSGTQDSQKEQDALRSRLQLSMSDNKILRGKISDLEEKLKSRDDEKDHHDNDHMMELERQKRSLVQQVANLKFQLKNYESLDDLTKMLQESHKSLISTNDRLLGELDETRSRHQSEVEQLKWSYDQLRKTSMLLGSTNGTTNGKDVPYTNGY
nr:centrosomal protein of 72 kDa-like isoform X2 [Styela clava]